MVSPENHGRSKAVLERQFAVKYAQKCAYNYAICIKEDNYPIGYVNVTTNHSHDLGYGLRKEFWHKGIAAKTWNGTGKRCLLVLSIMYTWLH